MIVLLNFQETFRKANTFPKCGYLNFHLYVIEPGFHRVGWLVGFGFNGPLRQYFSLYRAVSHRQGEREKEKIDESKNVQTTPTRTYCKRSRPLPYCNPNCRTPRHWKFTQYLAPPGHSRFSQRPCSFSFSFLKVGTFIDIA